MFGLVDVSAVPTGSSRSIDGEQGAACNGNPCTPDHAQTTRMWQCAALLRTVRGIGLAPPMRNISAERKTGAGFPW